MKDARWWGGVVAALGVALSGCDRAPSPPAGCGLLGIDVSRHQGEIDWRKVAAAGVRFAWIKATEGGDWRDATFARNWTEARTAGVKRGAYHFMSWCRPAAEQAAWFVANVPADAEALPPVLDLEWTPASRACPDKLPRDEALARIRVVLAAMERVSGKVPVIYAPGDLFAEVLDGGTNADPLARYPLWVRAIKAPPALLYGARRWLVWQHGDGGHVDGIGPLVDLDCLSPSGLDLAARRHADPQPWDLRFVTTREPTPVASPVPR